MDRSNDLSSSVVTLKLYLNDENILILTQSTIPMHRIYYRDTSHKKRGGKRQHNSVRARSMSTLISNGIILGSKKPSVSEY